MTAIFSKSVFSRKSSCVLLNTKLRGSKRLNRNLEKSEFEELALASNSFPLDPFSTLEEAEKLLSAIPQQLADRIVLIGGQALLLWAEYYLIDNSTGFQYEMLASDDLDFMGRRPDVIECAAAWDAEHRLPGPDDNSPHSGLVVLNNSGVFHTVDFLYSVYGISDQDVFHYSDEMIFGQNEIKVLSPPLCLKSRVENLNGLGYVDQLQERETVRIAAAIEITKLYLIDICNLKKVRALSSVVKYLMNDVLLSRAALSISARYNIDLAQVFPIEIIKSVHPPIAEKYLDLWLKTYHDRVNKRPKFS